MERRLPAAPNSIPISAPHGKAASSRPEQHPHILPDMERRLPAAPNSIPISSPTWKGGFQPPRTATAKYS